jgi:hypothetical protein
MTRIHKNNTPWKRINEPVVVDRGIDLLAAMLWLMYGLWGVFAVSAHIETLSRVVTTDYTIPWGAAIAALALAGSMAAFSTLKFGATPVRIFKKQIELWCVSMLGPLITLYPALLLIRVCSHPGFEVLSQFVLALTLIMFPVWRIRNLVKRIRGLRHSG